MRLKLIVVLAAIVAVFMFMCSCVKAQPIQTEEVYVHRVYKNNQMFVYKVTTPSGTTYVMKYGHGLCKLN